MRRCPWAKGDQYVDYPDKEWGVPDEYAAFNERAIIATAAHKPASESGPHADFNEVGRPGSDRHIPGSL